MTSIDDFVTSIKVEIFERQHVRKSVDENWEYILSSLNESISLLQIYKKLKLDGINVGSRSGFNNSVRKKQGFNNKYKLQLCIKCQTEITKNTNCNINLNNTKIEINNQKIDYGDDRHKSDF